jgi:hypothetical protein
MFHAENGIQLAIARPDQQARLFSLLRPLLRRIKSYCLAMRPGHR